MYYPAVQTVCGAVKAVSKERLLDMIVCSEIVGHSAIV
jgi:hypothetical protein